MTDSGPIRDELNGLREDLSEHRIEAARFEAAVDTRLDNGRKVFDELRKSIPNTRMVIGIAFGLLASVAGASWWLANRLNERPIWSSVERMIADHDKYGHEGMRLDLQTIKSEQSSQRSLIDRQVQKLDTLLERVPKRRGQ